ncbi:hypothetical protein SS1G_04472 [Sclerotinia sclerotiorum 1980 UF-70]|uniref:PLD phosphodiesterase domain-containing protein n=1 Tax=Sclerotinia sclerotiorum (strain ATCC 18683 / 1980 / Ss-1) TaxID=665079 RepID=A7EGN0_SCLS1|nr:hypothetical protein SS1G_04472 [Sclerotinia sclerotiorum 1980 UF-70]EDO01996.1 hypothetical protein SS1G_04472 [Sclerotinia sclerotiorum 1980 UF-70]
MAQYTGLEAASWKDLIRDWWQFILIAFILASIGLGLGFISYIALQSSLKRYQNWKSARAAAVPASIKKYLAKTYGELSHHKIVAVEKKPESFGVYLGSFNYTPTADELRLLAQWDLLVVDAFQENINHVLSCGLYHKPSLVLARLDLSTIVPHQCKVSTALEGAIEWVAKLVSASTASGSDCHFSGILISNWNDRLPSPVIIEFIAFAHKLGFQIYLETSSPGFLRDPKLAELGEVAGLIIRNGTISSNGDERDAFQMQEMRPTIKAFVSQACLRPFVVCLWETLDDGVNPTNAVVRRSYQWSKFYSALSPWIGSMADLTSTTHGINRKEPLGAFSWLKEPGVMKAHKRWRLNHTIASEYVQEISRLAGNLLGALSIEVDLQPSGKSTQLPFVDIDLELPAGNLQVPLDLPADSSEGDLPGFSSRSLTPTGSFLSIPAQNRRFSDGPYSYLSQIPGNPISTSPTGSSNDFLGCFPLGVYASRKSFDDILQSQKKLKSLDLLESVENTVLKDIGAKLNRFCDEQDTIELSPWHAAIQELANQLCGLADDSATTDLIRVYKGLDSGFQFQDGARYWAVFAFEERAMLDIFMSRNVQDLSGTILHTFLSSRGCPRHESFEAEKEFWQWSTRSNSYLSPRLLNDISSLSPSELLRFVQILQISSVKGHGDLIDSIIFACERQLLDAADFTQMKDACSTGYLGNQKSPQDLIALRTKWHEDNNSQHPSEENSLDVFQQINDSITIVLKERKLDTLQVVTKTLIEILEAEKIDARTDVICLALFSAFRKHAFEEAYVEVTDRNTLFNDQSDQAAAFAELFATGARCESYFDMTPSAFGKLLSDRYRACHHQPGREPPIWSDDDPSTPSAYAAAKIDIGDFKSKPLSGVMRFTFLSVFAIPALVDILLLTSTGKGLYLSGHMSDTAQHSATMALMISLLISCVCGTWITCGGAYYLISMAFSAMNMFVATRLVGGFAFSLVVGLIGFIALGFKDGIVAGVVFFLYLIAMSTYLSLLATLANFSYPGTTFQSGRPVILTILPLLFISPITTIFAPGYDIYIYLSVLYVFIFSLALGTRHIASKWTTWHQKIENISDKALKEWYIKAHKGGDDHAFDRMTDPAALKISRTAMIEEITKVRSGFLHKCQDPTVKSLAESYDATIFLLQWYSGYSGTPLPMPYSSTWNMQIKVALDTLKQMQTGLRLHNAFIHWRQAGDEYTKIFTGPRSLKPLLVAVCLGLPLGQILRHFFPQFEYCDVVALAAATWTAAFLSLYYAGIRIKPVDTMDSEGRVWNKISQDRSFHEFTSPGRDLLLSQDELRITFENLNALSDDEKYEVEPMAHPGLEIKSILHHAIEIFEEIKGSSVDSIPKFALSAFPEAIMLLTEAIAAFDSGKVVIECVSMSMFSDEFKDLKAISCDSNDSIRVIVGCEAMDAMEQQSSISIFCQTCTGQVDTLTTDQHNWLRTNKLQGLSLNTFMARRNFGAFVAMEKRRYTLEFAKTAPIERPDKYEKSNMMNLFKKARARRGPSKLLKRQLKSPFSKVYHTIGHCIKLFAIAFVAEPELQRELDYTMRSTPKYIRPIVMFLITGIWSYAKILQDLLMPMFLLHGRKNVETLWKQIRGTTVSLKRQKIMIESTGGSSTAFVRVPDTASIAGGQLTGSAVEDTDAVQESLLGSGICELRQYSGVLDQEPADGAKLERISIYSKDLLLLRREDYVKGARTNVYEYEYDAESIPKQKIMKSRPRYPISRRCVEGKNEFEQVSFNNQGLVQSGSYILDGNLVRFNCHYRQNSNFDDELLRAEFVLPHMFCMVSWAAPPTKHQDKLDTWIPHSQVIEATFVIGPDVYEAQWSYDHKYHPTIFTTLNGEPVETPALIQWDHLGVLKKPTNFTFRHDDHMISFKSFRSHAVPRWLVLPMLALDPAPDLKSDELHVLAADSGNMAK